MKKLLVLFLLTILIVTSYGYQHNPDKTISTISKSI